VVSALHDIQRLRNRSAHDGHQVADEDELTAVRRLLDVLAWYTNTGSDALSGHALKLAPAVAAKAEFLAGLYVTLDYRPAKRFELSRHTVYQLFVRERGLRSEYVELLLSRDADDVAQVLEVTGGELLQTRLPKLTRFLILEEDGGGEGPDALQEAPRAAPSSPTGTSRAGPASGTAPHDQPIPPATSSSPSLPAPAPPRNPALPPRSAAAPSPPAEQL
jgi:hypothetical protein